MRIVYHKLPCPRERVLQFRRKFYRKMSGELHYIMPHFRGATMMFYRNLLFLKRLFNFPGIPKLFLISGSEPKKLYCLICYRSCHQSEEGNTERKRRETDENQKPLRSAPLRNRRTIQSLSSSTGIPRSKLQYAEARILYFVIAVPLSQL